MIRCARSAQRRATRARRLKLDGVPLAVAEGEGVAAPPRGARHGQRGGGVESSRKQHDAPWTSLHGG